MTNSKLIRSIAMWCIAKATQETTTGNYIIYINEITKIFEINNWDVLPHIDEIIEEMESFPSVSDVIFVNVNYSFDINLFTDYCFNDID